MTGALHGGGGNEALRDYGIKLQAAEDRGQYQRDTAWLESIIPTIEGRSNIIPKIKQAKEAIAQKTAERQSLIEPNQEIRTRSSELEELKNQLSAAEAQKQSKAQKVIAGYTTEKKPIYLKDIGYIPVHQARYPDPNRIVGYNEVKNPNYDFVYDENDKKRVDELSKTIMEKQQELESIKQADKSIIDDIEDAEKELQKAQSIPITAPEKTYGYSWAPYGLYNNEYQYQQSAKSVAIAEAKARLRELQNFKTNYEEDVREAKKLQRLLDQYEKEKKFEFLNDYESRTDNYVDVGGLFTPAMTPTGMLRYKQRYERGLDLKIDPVQVPFEDKPLWTPPRQHFVKETVVDRMFSVPNDDIMRESNRVFKADTNRLKSIKDIATDNVFSDSQAGMMISDSGMKKAMGEYRKRGRFFR